MVILVTMTTTLPLAEVKSHLSGLVGRVNSNMSASPSPCTASRRPSSSRTGNLESLEETIAIVSDPGEPSRLAASQAELARGEAESEEQLAPGHARPTSASGSKPPR